MDGFQAMDILGGGWGGSDSFCLVFAQTHSCHDATGEGRHTKVAGVYVHKQQKMIQSRAGSYAWSNSRSKGVSMSATLGG